LSFFKLFEPSDPRTLRMERGQLHREDWSENTMSYKMRFLYSRHQKLQKQS
ncbi:hypothetical protein XENOCAPTIV_025849, partial [Xenoophorus captivus]